MYIYIIIASLYPPFHVHLITVSDLIRRVPLLIGLREYNLLLSSPSFTTQTRPPAVFVCSFQPSCNKQKFKHNLKSQFAKVSSSKFHKSGHLDPTQYTRQDFHAVKYRRTDLPLKYYHISPVLQQYHSFHRPATTPPVIDVPFLSSFSLRSLVFV